MQLASYRFFIIFFFFAQFCIAQHRPKEELKFSKSTYTIKISQKRFEHLKINYATYIANFQQHKLPRNYILAKDTLAQVQLVSYIRGKRLKSMIAVQKKNCVVLFKIGSGGNESIREGIKNDIDITGDSINEVFIYFDRTLSYNGNFSASQGSTRRLEVWDTETCTKLLDTIVGTGGYGTNFCTGKNSSYGEHLLLSFFTGGFNVGNETFISEERADSRKTTTALTKYLYTPKAFVLDKSTDCCTLHLSKNFTTKELKSEYKRLRIENKDLKKCCLQYYGSLRESMRLLRLHLKSKDQLKKVLSLFGAPDLISATIPAEIMWQQYITEIAMKKDIVFINYQIRDKTYLYFIFENNKMIASGWDNGELYYTE